eukprot:2187189-Alexandrium_andersonii.AAC.1
MAIAARARTPSRPTTSAPPPCTPASARVAGVGGTSATPTTAAMRVAGRRAATWTPPTCCSSEAG